MRIFQGVALLCITAFMVSCGSVKLTKRRHRPGYFVQLGDKQPDRQNFSKCEKGINSARQSKNEVLEECAQLSRKEFVSTTDAEYVPASQPVDKEQEVDEEISKSVIEGAGFLSEKKNSERENFDGEDTDADDKVQSEEEHDWAIKSGVLKFLISIGILGAGLLMIVALSFLVFIGAFGELPILIVVAVVGMIATVVTTIAILIYFLIRTKFFKSKRGLE